MNTKEVAERVLWGLKTGKTNSPKSFLLDLVIMILSLLCVVCGSKLRKLRKDLTLLMKNSRKRPTKRKKASSSKANNTTTMLTQDGGIKWTKTTSGTSGREGKAGSTDSGKREDNFTGVKRNEKSPVLRFNQPKHREIHKNFNDKVLRQQPPSLGHFAIEEMARPEPVIDDQHRREAALHDVFCKGIPQKNFLLTQSAGRTGQNGFESMSKQLIPISKPDPTPTLCLGNIPRFHYADLYFPEVEAQHVNKMEWLWGTYGALRQHGTVASLSNNRNAFCTVMEHYGIPLTME